MATKRLRGTTTRRLLAGVVAAATIGALAACSSGGGTSGDGEPSGKLQFLVSSSDATDAGFRAVNDAFEKQYPDVDVVFSTVSNDNYPASKSSRLTASNLDLFVMKNFMETPSYAKDAGTDDVRLAKAGGLVDLTDQAFLKEYTPSLLDAQVIDGKQYAVPTGVSYYTGVFYNKKIFADNGLKVPTTWSEFTAVVDALKAKGVTPFGLGGKDSWPAGLPMLASVASLYPTAADKQQLAKDLWTNKAKLTDPTEVKVLEQTEYVLKNAQEGASGADYTSIPAGFASGDFAMTVDGTWDQPTIDAAVGGAFDYGYFPFPGSDDAADNALLNGKTELQLAVPASAKNKTAALAWLKFFSEKKNYELFLSKSGFSSAQPGVSTSEFLQSIADYTKSYEPAWDQVWFANNKAGQDAVFPFNYPALTPLGSSTPQQAAEAAQKAWSAAG
ncbi:extracellular solute-binding protein [Leifsonia sp. F6_8S_P_1B]|uniref:Extracellular solute-binding protein n=1 Tax=Leifsonia williamsii TaxID=3035919 RepID=A0ABT8KA42_9MICO|nr:extracellular solute-binding protein [Leifsonia williamsii]MDN4613352.1 extracellular solute-binding protein [Leifsonia williamsii]